MKIDVPTDIPDQRIRDVLTAAFEGGSNYWYSVLRYEYAEGLTAADFREGGKMQDPNPDHYHHPCQLVPLIEGCAVVIVDKEDDARKEHRLDRAAIARGLVALRDQHPRHFADLVSENDDADTGDAFLQCCLFGKLVYG